MRSAANQPGVHVELVDLEVTGADEWRDWYDDEVIVPRSRMPGVWSAVRARGVPGDPSQPVPAMPPMEIGVFFLDDASIPISDRWRATAAGSSTTRSDWREDIRRRAISATYVQTFSTPPRDPASTFEILHGAFFEVPEPHHEEFDDWYELEHIEAQMQVPGYLSGKRYQGADNPCQFLALYEVDQLSSTASEAALAAMKSGWGDRIRSKIVTARARRLFRIDRTETRVSDA